MEGDSSKGLEVTLDDTMAQAAGKVIAKARQNIISDSVADVPIPPDNASHMDIDITKEFRWTKSAKDSVAVKTIPTVTLREYIVTVPAFFQNLKLLTEQVYGPGKKYGDDPEGYAKSIKNLADKLPNPFKMGLNSALEGVQGLSEAVTSGGDDAFGVTKFDMPSYLKSYENIYGVKKTNFIYRLPYLEDSFKTISNNWSRQGSILATPIQFMAALTAAVSPGVGIDFSKTFQYPDAGPSYNMTFYLDNTRFDDISEWMKNYRFIFLLIYQNLPNRINKSALTPPVIYQSSLPGVFSYRWSFLSNINVNFIGVRRKMPPFKVTRNTSSTEVIIPEGYEVQLTLTSLTPETKNLMFDSINNPVRSHEESEPFTGPVPESAINTVVPDFPEFRDPLAWPSDTVRDTGAQQGGTAVA
tara:strand:+ start:10 stop:1248 length:1239 start_codon:yes stop_codon:yes gene_type:complete